MEPEKSNAILGNNIYIPRNRKERRALAKKMKISNQVLNEMIKNISTEVAIDFLPNGTKVKLKYDRIIGNDNGQSLSEPYIDFIKSHKDDILTVQRDPEHGDDYQFVLLEEDDKPVSAKWKFHYSDLELVLD